MKKITRQSFTRLAKATQSGTKVDSKQGLGEVQPLIFKKPHVLSLGGFTLIELIVVVIIIGVLASIVVPSYVRTREKAMDKQAQAILVLIRSAERRFKMERGYYYNKSGTTTIPEINGNLSLDLVDDGNWYPYTIQQAGTSGFYASLTRTTNKDGNYGRTWWINSTNVNASCSPTAGENGCP